MPPRRPLPPGFEVVTPAQDLPEGFEVVPASPTKATLTLEPAQPGTYAPLDPYGASLRAAPPPPPDATTGTPSPWEALRGVFSGTQRLPGQAGAPPAGQAPEDLVVSALGHAVEEAIPATPSQNPWLGDSPTKRGLFGLGAGALTSATGFPIDMLNLPLSLGYVDPKTGQRQPLFQLPGGSHQQYDWLTKGLEHLNAYSPPETGSSGEMAERMGRTVGGFVGPGRVASSLSAGGPVRDFVMGLSAAFGQEGLRAMFPGSTTAEMIGAIGGPLVVTGLHALGSVGLQAVGSGAVKRAAVQEALTEVGSASQQARQAQVALETATQQVQDSYGQVLQGQEAHVRDLQQQVYTANLALEQAKTRAHDAIGRVTEQTNMQTGAAASYADQLQGQQRQATQRLQDTFGGLGTTLPPGPYPTQQEATVIGAAGKEAAVQSAETLRGERSTSFQDFFKGISQRFERLEVATRTGQWAQKAIDLWHKNMSELFDKTEAVTGNEPVLYLRNLHGTEGVPQPGSGVPPGTRPMLQEAQQTGQGVPRGTAALERTGRIPPGEIAEAERAQTQAGLLPGLQQPLTADELQQLLSAPGFLQGLTAEQRTIAQQFLARMTTEYGPDIPIPYWLGRRIESGLNEIAYRNAQPVGTLQQGRARQLLWGLRKDLANFYTETPEGMQIRPDIQAAKQGYADGVRTFSDGLMQNLYNKTPGAAEAFLDSLWSTKSTEQMIRIRQVADDPTWQMLQANMMASLYEKASPGKVFQPQRFENLARQLEQNGKLDILLEPGSPQRAAFDAERQQMTAFDQTYQVQMRKTLEGRSPDQVVPYVFAPGALARTQNFRAISTPEQFDTAVKAWVGRFMTEAQDLPPAQIQKKLAAMEGQFATMFAAYPGMADQVRDLTRQFRQGSETVTRLGRQSALATEGAAQTRALGEGQAQLVTEAAQRPVQAAEQALTQAQDALKRASLQYDAATAAKGQDIAKVKGVSPEARAVEATQAEVERTTDALRKARLDAKQPESGVEVPAGRLTLHAKNFLGALGTLLVSVTTGHPYVATGAAMDLTYEVGRYGLGKMAQTPGGRQILAHGLPPRYGAAAAQFARQVVAGGASPPPAAPPAPAPTPAGTTP